jgi:hypothetical protein
LPPAQPLPPAGINPVPPAGDTTAAFDMSQMQAMNGPFPGSAPAVDLTAPVQQALAPPPGPTPPPGSPNLPWSGGPPVDGTSGIKTALETVKPAAEESWITKGAKQAWNLVQSAGKAYADAPMPIQALGAMTAYNKFMVDKPSGPAKYKRTPYDGLSPNFEPGGPSPYLYGFADGGITGTPNANTQSIGPVENMSQQNTLGANTGYPMATQQNYGFTSTIAPSPQRPISENMLNPEGDMRTDPYTGELTFSDGGYAEEKEAKENAEQRKRYAQMMGNNDVNLEESLSRGQSIASMAHGKGASITGHGIIPRSRAQSLGSPNSSAQSEIAAMMKKYGIKASMPKTLDPQSGNAGAGETEAANGGIMYGLGGYSDGGRLLRGPGDGVSDSIPAQIGSRQPARLADGEFVIPARIVSELGNGSTEAGARQLYSMMDRVQQGRKKSVGKGKVAVNSKAAKHLPA